MEISNIKQRKNKKGNIFLEGITILVVIFVLVIISIMGHEIFKDVNDTIQSDSQVSDSAKEHMQDSYVNYPKIIDGIFIFLLVGLWIASVSFAFFIETNPVFFVMSIILIIIVLIVGAIISNAYVEIANDDGLSQPVEIAMPMSYFVMSNLVYTILVIVASIGIGLFAKSNM